MSHTVTRRAFVTGLAAASTGLVARRAVAGARPPRRADLLLVNGQVITLDPRGTIAEAVAITGDGIAAVGRDAELAALRAAGTEVVDLGGRAVVPGINDSHLHAAMWGLTRPPFTVDLGYPGVRSIADVAAAIGRAAAARPEGEWIRGWGWDSAYFAEGRAPTRQDLDRVAPRHPVALTEFSGHAVWLNSRALELANVTRETVPPAGGVIVKDAAGEPTGVLLEGAAGALYRVLPAPSEADQAAAIGAAIDGMHREGITSYTEPGIDAATLGRYAARARAGELGARLTVLLRGGPSVESVRSVLDLDRSLAGIDPRWLRVAGVKLFADGIPTINRTAWLHDPYVGGGHGSLTLSGATDEERLAGLARMVALVHDAGLQIGTHATGDRAIDAVVDAYVRAMEARPRADARHYVIHADLTSPATLRRMAARGIGANFNAAIKHMIMDGQVDAIGPVRAAYEWPYRTALDAGVAVASSSDAPVTYPNWRQGVATCLLRKGRKSGEVFGPEQRIDLMQALRTYTTAGAWQDRAETWKGSIEAGKVADLCVVDGPLIGRDPEALPETGVAMTIVGGRVVHRTV